MSEERPTTKTSCSPEQIAKKLELLRQRMRMLETSNTYYIDKEGKSDASSKAG